jgi:hypothetical protein
MGPNRKSQRRASHAPSVSYAFLVETYATERFKTLGVWSMFRDEDLDIRPHPNLAHDRTAHEHMVHQCLSEDKWFCTMFGIDVGAPPLPKAETRLDFIEQYATDSAQRLAGLETQDAAWWEREVAFFDTRHGRAHRPSPRRDDDPAAAARAPGAQRVRPVHRHGWLADQRREDGLCVSGHSVAARGGATWRRQGAVAWPGYQAEHRAAGHLAPWRHRRRFDLQQAFALREAAETEAA